MCHCPYRLFACDSSTRQYGDLFNDCCFRYWRLYPHNSRRSRQIVRVTGRRLVELQEDEKIEGRRQKKKDNADVWVAPMTYYSAGSVCTDTIVAHVAYWRQPSLPSQRPPPLGAQESRVRTPNWLAALLYDIHAYYGVSITGGSEYL